MAGIGELLRHVGKGSCQTVKLITPLKRGLGRQIPRSHLPDAIGQKQQRPGNLVAHQNRQHHRPKHRQEQTERQGSDVHTAQSTARQCPLLIFPIGCGNLQRIGHQGGRQRARGQQKTRLAQQIQAGT